MKKSKTTDIVNLIKTMEKPVAKIIEYGEGEDKVIIETYPTIPFTKRSELIQYIVNLVFDMSDDTSVINYQPQYKELAKRYAVVHFYSNATFPTNIDSMWLILTKTDIFSDVCKNIEDDLDLIFKEADELIEARKAYLIQHKDFDDLKAKISNAINEVTTKFEGFDIEKIMSQFPNLEGLQASDIMGTLMKENKKNVKENTEKK